MFYINAVVKRPLLYMCIAFLAVLIIGLYLPVGIKLIFLTGFVFSAVILAITFGKRFIFVVMLLAFAVGALLLSLYYNDVYCKNAFQHIGTESYIRATVYKASYISESSSFYDIRITEIDGKPVSIKAKLEGGHGLTLAPFDEVSLTVSFHDFEKSQNGFPEKTYNLSKNYLLRAVATRNDYRVTGRSSEHIRRLFYSFNSSLRSILMLTLDRNTACFLSGIILGNKQDVPDAVVRDFRNVGLSHMLAVSGLHFTIIISGLNCLLVSVNLHRKIRNVIIILTVLFFIGLFGTAPSVLRSGIMMLLFLLPTFLGREGDSPTALLVAVTLICIVSPSSIMDISLFMSFFSTLGIITLGNYLLRLIDTRKNNGSRIVGVFGFLIKSVTISFSATVFMLPIMWLGFGYISIISPLVNLIVIPFAAVIMYVSFILFLTFRIPFLFNILATVLEHSVHAICKIAYVFGKLPWSCVSLSYEFTPYVAVFCLLFFSFLLLIKAGKVRSFFCALIAFTVIFGGCRFIYQLNASDVLKITCLNVKRNDGVVVISDGKSLLFDMSDGSATLTDTVISYLAENCHILSLDAYVITHYHSRQMSGFRKFSDKTYIRNLFLPKPLGSSDISVYESLVQIADDNGCKVFLYSPDDIIVFGDSLIEPGKQASLSRSVQYALSFNITCNEQNFLYIGAAYTETDSSFAAEKSRAATDIFFGIHGPVIKQTPLLPNDIFPKTVVFSNSDVYSLCSTVTVGASQSVTLNDAIYYHELLYNVK